MPMMLEIVWKKSCSMLKLDTILFYGLDISKWLLNIFGGI